MKKSMVTPQDEANRSLDAINAMIGDCMVLFDAIADRYTKQISDEPTSWRGIGRGSDLAALEDQLKQVRDLMERMDRYE